MLVVESFIQSLLKRHFGGHKHRDQIAHLFQHVAFKTQMGQMLDTEAQPGVVPDLSQYSMHRYKCIVKYKTSFYSFYLPVALGIVLADCGTPAALARAEAICLAMGEYFQIQDDVLDCYGDPKVIGKIGTDIQDGKCSWLAVNALELAGPEQLEVFKANYARDEEGAIALVKEVYKSLGLEQRFQEFEERSHQQITAMVSEGTEGVPREVYDMFLAKIYKRSK